MAPREYHVFPTIQAYGACGLKYEKELFDTFFFFWIIFSYFYCRLFTFLGGFTHSVHWGINPPSQKKISLLFAKPPPLSLKSANCPSSPFLGSPPSILVFREPHHHHHHHAKNWIFQWIPNILKIFILNPILHFKSN